MKIKEYLRFYRLSLEEIFQNYNELYTKSLIDEKTENWLINIEDKLNLLKNNKERDSIRVVIFKLKNNDMFTIDDTENLNTFISKINSIVNIADRINNFKEGTSLDNNEKLSLFQLFNKMSTTNSLKNLNHLILNQNLNIFKAHLFSIIKHCQNPKDYPIYYKFWRNICKEVLEYSDDYDSLCLLYRKFPENDRHIIFGVYFGVLAKLIISNFFKSNVEDKEKGIKYIKEKVINLDKYMILLNKEFNSIKIDNKSIKIEPMIPLNQILFGAPGTGKTYNTKKIAVEIIKGEKVRSREDINDEYENLVNAKQIVFTTFHQSLSYEDFIEGIKPETSDGNVTYEVKDGIFKSLCQNANPKNTISFENAYEKLQQKLAENEIIELKTPTDKTFLIALNKNGNLSLMTGSKREKQGVLTKEKLLQQLNGKQVFIGWEGYFKGVINYLKSEFNFNPETIDNTKNYVLIIDEINRGNVSAIFGELITLLEEDKRKGNKEQIEVTLPYSADKFSVPNNVYIIGTMNTADRSVEALDTALRRRFSFTEMQPNPEILLNLEYQDVNMKRLLKTINQRIEVLIDKDHQIGHSYFIGIKNLEDLKMVFKDKIIPLLEEYFYGDFGKIGLVLGGNFIFQEDNNAKFPKNFNYEKDFLEDKKVYRIMPIDVWDKSTFISVYED